MYDDVCLATHKHTWNNLSPIALPDLPWLLVGDFNTILNPTKHKGDNFNYYALKAKYFNYFISRDHFSDLGFYGPGSTWYNG